MWHKDLLPIIISWPSVFLIIFAFLVFSKKVRKAFIELLKPFQKIKVGSAELVLNKEESAKISKSIKNTFTGYREQVNSEYDLFVERYNISIKLEAVVEEMKNYPNVFKKGIKNLRCTIHMPDILFDNTLYQLLDYYPGGQGKGRIKSVRFGIIGKAWRLGKPITQGQVSTNSEDLIKDWGMTRNEATIAGVSRQSLSCVMLRDKSTLPVGIFYMDAEEKDAFAINGLKSEELHKLISSICIEKKLTETLAKLSEELRGRAPLIQIYD